MERDARELFLTGSFNELSRHDSNNDTGKEHFEVLWNICFILFAGAFGGLLYCYSPLSSRRNLSERLKKEGEERVLESHNGERDARELFFTGSSNELSRHDSNNDTGKEHFEVLWNICFVLFDGALWDFFSVNHL
ncbi:hypothetical protein CEXT_554491 [Caerostris extrusa]|uniref:Transmembrane protein n=1 Tax=Caerostris extrusa TaxID=172846 RepID=A0AAV4NIL2_CAEEX|nr:hypothetical protein CEXT_554491 [Caerostris extrusa]